TIFDDFFPKENRTIEYLIIAKNVGNIDLSKYAFKGRIMLREHFLKMMKEIFEEQALKEDLFNNRNYIMKLQNSITHLTNNKFQFFEKINKKNLDKYIS
ncbi:MAG: hypothetical protein ACFE8P_13070, partial [Promethearchaeota archaeon]